MNIKENIKIRLANEANGTINFSTWTAPFIISLVLMLGQIFIVFLSNYDIDSIICDLDSFAFELFVFAGKTFFVNFGGLTGISVVAQKLKSTTGSTPK